LICVSAPSHHSLPRRFENSETWKFYFLVLIPRTFETIGTLERLEPTLVFSDLNGAQRLNDLNCLNGPQY
jgi:hypothetical protein